MENLSQALWRWYSHQNLLEPLLGQGAGLTLKDHCYSGTAETLEIHDESVIMSEWGQMLLRIVENQVDINIFPNSMYLALWEETDWIYFLFYAVQIFFYLAKSGVFKILKFRKLSIIDIYEHAEN